MTRSLPAGQLPWANIKSAPRPRPAANAMAKGARCVCPCAALAACNCQRPMPGQQRQHDQCFSASQHMLHDYKQVHHPPPTFNPGSKANSCLGCLDSAACLPSLKPKLERPEQLLPLEPSYLRHLGEKGKSAQLAPTREAAGKHAHHSHRRPCYSRCLAAQAWARVCRRFAPICVASSPRPGARLRHSRWQN